MRQHVEKRCASEFLLCRRRAFVRYNNYTNLPVAYYERVGGIVVSIAAFQAVDPGSIPGQRKVHFAQSISHPFFPPHIVFTQI